jgi:hypothetical protein
MMRLVNIDVWRQRRPIPEERTQQSVARVKTNLRCLRGAVNRRAGRRNSRRQTASPKEQTPKAAAQRVKINVQRSKPNTHRPILFEG